MAVLEHQIIHDIAGSTNDLGDWHRSLAALAYAANRGVDRAIALAIVIDKRFRWLDWLTVTQRNWQRHTRNPNKARHHDSISIREKYVRC